MIKNLLRETSIRSAFFKHASLILLRRRNKNNFIFLTKTFYSISDIITKYWFNCSNVSALFSLVDDKFGCDIIEFVLDNIASRNCFKNKFLRGENSSFWC